jgi:MoaA/NifB/PqqE/SkfB family radical SAM enzyme
VKLKPIPYVLWTYLISRQRKPFLASFKLTYRCNLHCQQCPFYQKPEGDLPFDQVEQMLIQLHSRGSRLVVFEGGEPLLWRDGKRGINDIVAIAKKYFFSVGVTTNGTLPLDVLCDILWVSVDGLAETHNRLRGADIFDTVISNIQRSAHPRLFAHITANSENAAEIPDLIRFLHPIVRGITLQFYYPYNQKDALFLDFNRRTTLIKSVITLKKQGYHILNSIPALKALQKNTWRCYDWLLDCANPDGKLNQGCYLKGRTDIDCSRCGFSPNTEISLAYHGSISAILAGIQIFL